jgi:hypothetical protein
MNGNKEKAAKLLQEALQNLPTSNTFSNVRIHIKRALSEIQHAEKKTFNHVETPSTNWAANNGVLVNPYAAKEAIAALDEMIDQEKQKIDELKKGKTNVQNVDTLLG